MPEYVPLRCVGNARFGLWSAHIRAREVVHVVSVYERVDGLGGVRRVDLMHEVVVFPQKASIRDEDRIVLDVMARDLLHGKVGRRLEGRVIRGASDDNVIAHKAVNKSATKRVPRCKVIILRRWVCFLKLQQSVPNVRVSR